MFGLSQTRHAFFSSVSAPPLFSLFTLIFWYSAYRSSVSVSVFPFSFPPSSNIELAEICKAFGLSWNEICFFSSVSTSSFSLSFPPFQYCLFLNSSVSNFHPHFHSSSNIQLVEISRTLFKLIVWVSTVFISFSLEVWSSSIRS